MVIAEEVVLDPTPTRGAEIDKAGGRQGPGQISPRKKRKHMHAPNTTTTTTTPYHACLPCLSRITRMNRLSPAVSCAFVAGWEAREKAKNGTLYVFQERAVCPKSFDIRRLAAWLMQAWQACQSGRPVCHS